VTERSSNASMVKSDLTDRVRSRVVMHTRRQLGICEWRTDSPTREVARLNHSPLMKSTCAAYRRSETNVNVDPLCRLRGDASRTRSGRGQPGATTGRHRHSRRNKSGVITSQ
ncbi:hypothetical protein LSAT2_015047, partial [Lamellibrachia satsuma]